VSKRKARPYKNCCDIIDVGKGRNCISASVKRFITREGTVQTYDQYGNVLGGSK
jgi:hypothetical protein